MLAITVYAGARNPDPIDRCTWTWNELHDEIRALCLTEHEHARDKIELPAFAPHRLREGASRSAEAVEAMSSACWIDVDHGLDLVALRHRVRELGIAAIVYGSPSDDVTGQRKARVIVQLDGEHPPEDCARVRASVAAVLGLDADRSATDAARIFFVGRLRGTPPREVWRHDGAPLALADLPAVPVRAARDAASAAPDTAPRDIAYVAASATIVAALGDWRDHAGRKHAICGAVGGVLRKAGWKAQHCETILRAWLPENEPGVDVDHGVRWALRAWDADPDTVSGRRALNDAVGNRIASIIDDASCLPMRSGMHVCDPGEDPAPAPSLVLLREVDRSSPPPPLRYVVPGVDLAAGKVSVLQGYAYTAKTPMALLLAVCVASGRDFLGHPTVQQPVAYLDFEGGVLTQEREARICAGLGLDRAAVPLHFFESPKLSDALLAEVRRVIAERSIGLLVIDTYSSALPHSERSFNDSDFRLWADTLGSLSRDTGVCVVILVHENKAAHGTEGLRGMSGHGSLSGAVQTSIALSRPDESAASVVEVRCARAARYGFAPIRVEWVDEALETAHTGSALIARAEPAVKPEPKKSVTAAAARATHGSAIRTAGERIMASGPDVTPCSRAELVSVAGGDRRPALEALARLVRAGMWTCTAGSYQRTDAGRAADEDAVRKALGSVGGFTA